MRNEREDNIIISTLAPSFMAWYGEYETGISIDGGDWRIAEGYNTLEESEVGHLKYSNMTKKELQNIKWIG